MLCMHASNKQDIDGAWHAHLVHFCGCHEVMITWPTSPVGIQVNTYMLKESEIDPGTVDPEECACLLSWVRPETGERSFTKFG
jgi:hypothetical protein